MIPVTVGLIEKIKLKNIKNDKYKNLLAEEIRTIREHTDSILQTVKMIRHKFNTNEFYRRICFDFEKLEKSLLKYLERNLYSTN